MAGEIQIGGTTFATESGGTVTVSNVDSAMNRTNLGLGSIATQASGSIDIDGGTIDGTTIGGTSAAAGTFTTFTSTGIDDNASSTALTIDSSGITHFNNGTIAPETITIADDAVGTIAMPNQSWTGGVAIVGVNTRSAFPFVNGYSIFYFDCGSSLAMQDINSGGSKFTFTTGAMTGTTGSDGTTNYSVVNSPSNALLIENREGSTLTYSYLLIQ